MAVLDPKREPERETERSHALRRERRSQVRGLLLIALVVLVFLLIRAQPLELFHPGWWRL